ncbi:MAG: serine/threonine-protein kinase [Cyanobacteria bacterium J06634_6]
MQLRCTRPNCPSPVNHFSDLDDPNIPQPLKQKYCSACRMELILRGRYLPVSLLGQGGFGTAFLARDFDSPTKRSCVVKLFQPPVTLTPDQMATAQRLFGKEAIVLERLGLQHPQIPNLYAYFPLLVTNPLTDKAEELFYLVQEYIDGEDLEKILDSQGKFAESDVKRVLKAMLEVLGFVHRNGAIHRDVKPSNIMQGKDGKLSLLDFGAVKEVTAPTGIQRGPTTICSPEYAPPEQIMNGTVDKTSDLYALAASCVVLLTEKSSVELRDSISNQWKWKQHAQVSSEFADILERMLQPNPRDRYPSAEAVLTDLKTLESKASGQGARTVQVARGSSGGSFGAASGSGPSGGASVAGSVTSGGTIVSPPQQSPPIQPPSPPAAPPTPPPVVAPAAPFSMTRFLGNAAFSGVQGGLLAIASTSLLGTRAVGHIAWVVMLAVLGVLQFRRTIEGMDLVIIAAVTSALVIFFRPLHKILLDAGMAGGLMPVVIIAVMAGCGMVILAVVFRLIFRVISELM